MPGQFSDYCNLRSPGPNIIRINVLYCAENKCVDGCVWWGGVAGPHKTRTEGFDLV